MNVCPPSPSLLRASDLFATHGASLHHIAFTVDGMRERLDSVGGTLSLAAGENGGTLLRASVPVAA